MKICYTMYICTNVCLVLCLIYYHYENLCSGGHLAPFDPTKKKKKKKVTTQEFTVENAAPSAHKTENMTGIACCIVRPYSFMCYFYFINAFGLSIWIYEFLTFRK